MGMKKQAEQEQALLLTEKADPEALTRSLSFLTNHPEISKESIPWHVHTDLPDNENSTAPK